TSVKLQAEFRKM
nr:Chain C, peptide 8-1 [Severe acute respiratory syndrome coronavirus 2]8GW4_D Chain D, peptide 8-1 [Severe acute respiratory syndrome coronavirus 2]